MKRKLSILLCGTLAAGMLTACGGKKEMTGSETNAKSTGEEETVTIWQSGCKYIGYFLGKRYHKFPVWFVKRCSMNHSYWN